MIAKVLLVSSDPRVIGNVRQAVHSVPECQLDVTATFGGLPDSGPSPQAVFFHLAPPAAGNQLLELLDSGSQSGKAPVIAISDHYDATEAMQLLSHGAADYLGRPLNLGRVAMLTDILTAKVRLSSLANGTVPVTPPPEPANALPGASFLCCTEEMTGLVDDARTVAPLETTVLLSGETGTGKTRLARLIHDLSPRRLEPFVVVNCGALSASLIESELFGHVKGAFTGAERDREGKCAAAGAGTLVLDDIDVLSASTQSKLLRAVDERVFEPVGSNHPQPLGARILVATNQCLKNEVEAGRFRADLYYRVNVVALQLPPLREQVAMIEPLARQFLGELGLRDRGLAWDITADALAALQAYPWPGNIRELRNVLERAVALGRGHCCQLWDLPAALQQLRPPGAPESEQNGARSRWRAIKRNNEAKTIGDMLARCGNNRSMAARELGISRVAFYKMLHKHGFI